MTYIGGQAFFYCKGLTSVTIPESVTYIGEGAFYGCSGLMSVAWNAKHCSDVSLWNGEYSLFHNNTLLTITFGDKVEHIPAYLCYGCSGLTSVTIPEGVTSIGAGAFERCTGLTSVTWNAKHCLNHSSWHTSLTTITFGDKVEYIPAYLCDGCSGLTSVTIPEGVDTIGWAAFRDCDGLTSVTIPNSVTYIGGEAFFDCDGLTSVTIPNSVTYIGERAFFDCRGLTSVTIPNSVTYIGERAFFDCRGLTSVTIGAGIAFIGEYAFSDCSELKSLSIMGDSVVFGGPRTVFEGCSSLESIEWNVKHCPDFEDYGWGANNPFYNNKASLTSITFGDKVEHIPAYLCCGCSGLTSVTIPEGVTSIGAGAFAGCGLASVEWLAKRCSDLPSSIATTAITIGKNVAYIPANLCAVTSVYYAGDIAQWCGLEFGCKREGEYEYGWCGCKSIYGNSYSYSTWNLYIDNEKVTDLVIPEGVTAIGEWPFFSCVGLASLTIPASVDSIRDRAFWGCSGLKSVEWNAKHCQDFYNYDYYNNYDKGLFSNNTSIESVTFGNKVEHIPAYLCYNCYGLTSVTIPKNVVSIGSNAFHNCGDFSVYYGGDIAKWCDIDFNYAWNGSDEYRYSGWDLYIDNKKVTDLVIPASVTTIGDNAFENCTGLTSVTIPNSDTIGSGTFSGCRNLASATFGESVSFIWDRAFRGCSALTSVEIPNGVNWIFWDTFEDCYGLTSVTIPNSVTWIMDDAFSGCSGLRSITLPRSLELLSEDAFAGCDNLISVTCRAPTPPRIGWYYDDDEDGEYEIYETTEPVFSNYYYSTLYVPYGCKNAYQSAQEWYKFSKIEELPSAGTATVTLRVNDASMGTVIGGGTYNLDEQVTLAAIPNQGYYFDRWDDGKTANPRILTVEGDITLTAIFAKTGSNPNDPNDPNDPSDPNNPGGTTANEESLAAAPFAYVQGRTAYLSDGLGEVEAFTATGQRVYRGFDRSVTLPRPGVYILRVVADGRRCKVIVR